MKAIGIKRGENGVHLFRLPRPAITRDDEVLIRILEAGLDGTDFNIISHNLQDIAHGKDKMVIGHEAVGVVVNKGTAVTGVKAGDYVVMTVRRGCGVCQPCLHENSDMCLTGLYTESGIHKKNGFLAQYVVERERYVIKVDESIKDLAVFAEPLSVAEKGIEQIKRIQSRLPWACGHPSHDYESENWAGCKTALVIGAGPLGLMAAALLCLAGAETYILDILPLDSVRVKMAIKTGAIYIDARDKQPNEALASAASGLSGKLDIVFEAAGDPKVAMEMINHMSRTSIYVMAGIPRDEAIISNDFSPVIRQIVSQNKVIVGSVNSNRSHFEMAVKHLPEIEKRFGGMLSGMKTNRYHVDEYREAFVQDNIKRVKTVITF